MKKLLIIFLLLPILTYGQNIPADTVSYKETELIEELHPGGTELPGLTEHEVELLTRKDKIRNVIQVGLIILLLVVLFFGIKFLLLKPKEGNVFYKFSLHRIENRMGLLQLFLWGIIAFNIFIALAIIYGVIDIMTSELMLVTFMLAPLYILPAIVGLIIYFVILRSILKKGFGVISRYKKAKEIEV